MFFVLLCINRGLIMSKFFRIFSNFKRHLMGHPESTYAQICWFCAPSPLKISKANLRERHFFSQNRDLLVSKFASLNVTQEYNLFWKRVTLSWFMAKKLVEMIKWSQTSFSIVFGYKKVRVIVFQNWFFAESNISRCKFWYPLVHIWRKNCP